MNDNGLTGAQMERLVIIAEEAGEVIQAVTKILRHGWRSTHPSCPSMDNGAHLVKELGDLRAAIQLCIQAGEILQPSYQYHALEKLARVKKYLHYGENMSLAEEALDLHNGA